MRHASFLLAAAALALAGCASEPSTIVAGPTTARPIPVPATAAPANGSIYQAQSFRPVFEDRRGRMVGDIINVVITERTTANKNGTSSASKKGGVGFGVPGPLQGRFGANIATETNNNYSDAAAQSASNAFSGTLGVTVVEVLPNGNLVIAGEKQVAMDKGTEFIRISGVVNPDTIGAGNSVPSTAIADARVEYRTNTHLDRSELTSMASRFFMSLLPF
ncbi:flagellar L-ring protein precursor FlgH [Pseudoduganella flava]|uniref:Flagellar L-ring protein n=1 Tax=Pseudoduganella flava TaxID=871742 RepID=A0A562PSN5_9BURK|nr:flagellar basal body L-ring protein FlgH [Pseudoduganella flava]QGZ39255.1 flagellar biosynthesis protein FlgH [Pseudoduganella flava]TWI47445.1 flagellar L-ring protein precursor FlgH [Pseudoduganella flava]